MSDSFRPKFRHSFHHRHLLGIEHLDQESILSILDLADLYVEMSPEAAKKEALTRGRLRGKTVFNVFMESSTRTRTSFEIAAKRLSADVINISASGSSMTKGETLLDTVRNLDAMKSDVIILRHPSSGAAQMISPFVSSSVVNAGDGMHEHPTQALIDCATIRKHKGKIDGQTVAIVGDIAHSRVARSNIFALRKLGAHVRVAGPMTLMPVGIEAMGVEVSYRVEEVLRNADVVMVLRLQKERQEDGLIPSLRDYSRYFGIHPQRLELAKPDAIVMHPGPMNRGVEISPLVADGKRSVILEQVTYGVAVRMAVLESVVERSSMVIAPGEGQTS